MEYQWDQRVANPFKQDTWLKAISIRPGDRRVLHHVVSQLVAEPRRSGGQAIPGGSVGSYTPGADAQVIPAEAGAPIPAGGKLNFQMHYTTMGKESVDNDQGRFLHAEERRPSTSSAPSVIAHFGALHPRG